MRKINLCVEDAFMTVIDTEDHFSLGDLIDYASRRANGTLTKLDVVLNGQEIDLLRQLRGMRWNELRAAPIISMKSCMKYQLGSTFHSRETVQAKMGSIRHLFLSF